MEPPVVEPPVVEPPVVEPPVVEPPVVEPPVVEPPVVEPPVVEPPVVEPPVVEPPVVEPPVVEPPVVEPPVVEPPVVEAMVTPPAIYCASIASTFSGTFASFLLLIFTSDSPSAAPCFTMNVTTRAVPSSEIGFAAIRPIFTRPISSRVSKRPFSLISTFFTSSESASYSSVHS